MFRPHADLDIEEIGAFFAGLGGEPLVARFLLAVDKAVDFICENLLAGSARFFQNPKPGERTLRVIRALHGKRDVESILMQEQG